MHSNRLLASRAEARAQPRGDLELRFCRDCGFIQNQAFDPSLQVYAEDYEDAQAGSPRFRRFSGELVEHLVERYRLEGSCVLEIGCGRGDFLNELCQRTGGPGIGIDPAFRPSEVSRHAPSSLRFVREHYGSQHAALDAALVACRHTLEHLQEPRAFVELLRANLEQRPETPVYFEVPDTERILVEQAFWDVYYEHVSYFTCGSLARLFRAAGFELLDLRLGFAGQYLMLEARPGTRAAARGAGADDEVERLERQVESFAVHVAETLGAWRERLAAWQRAGRRVALWGSGSKAVGFLTSLQVDGEVACVVDINPRKQGTFQAGTGHPIVSPRQLAAHRPDVVIVMNPVYRDEIGAELEAMGVQAELRTL